ncbi:MAG: sigma-70 family RNA polymerase sigma factor [Planctomycetes bacterium]|nr:sigma-70 family RNA polymerase sigma factor [Planctomycetota bacterium]
MLTKTSTLEFDRGPAQAKPSPEDLLILVYGELRRLAAVRLGGLPPGQTLQPTALVHEAYLRLVACPSPHWDNPAHFFAAAARSMRNILVDIARRKACVRHGGARRRRGLDADLAVSVPVDDDILAIDEALQVLEQRDPAKAELVSMRYFAGLSNEQIADALGVSVTTIERRWRYVRAWLRQFLEGGAAATRC